MKEKWTAGKTGGCVVSDTPNRHSVADDDHVDYYGGHLVAESIPKREYVNLIAAAPDLLAIAEKAVADCPGDSCSIEWHYYARATIKKAKGETS